LIVISVWSVFSGSQENLDGEDLDIDDLELPLG
jgi:hypothetical protein